MKSRNELLYHRARVATHKITFSRGSAHANFTFYRNASDISRFARTTDLVQRTENW